MNIQTQLRRLNFFGFSACLRITDAVWVVFLISRGFSLWQVGLAEGIFHMVSLLCEIPSGMAADLIGRRRCLAMAGFCGMVSALLMAFSRSFFGVCLSMVFSALSGSFLSGSDEALLYDSLVQADNADKYIPKSAAYNQMQNLGFLCSNLAAGLAAVWSYVGFYLLDSGICLVRMLTALSLTEPTVTKQQAARQQHPFADLKARFREHISIVAGFLRSHPKAAVLMLADGFVTLPSYLTLMFLQQRLSEQGVPTMWLGLPVMCIAAARMWGTAMGKRLRPKSIPRLYSLCAILVGSGTVIAGAASIVPAIAGAALAAAAMDAWVLHLQNALNRLYPADQRATLVSVNMMAYSVLMIAASPVVGWIGDALGTAGAGLWVLGALIGLSGLISFLIKRHTAE
ncbi:MAG: MFS transporter [Oscillospiraceae bacterium]|nr:MFS transporter [Oscillospiraceae bacterium]